MQVQALDHCLLLLLELPPRQPLLIMCVSVASSTFSIVLLAVDCSCYGVCEVVSNSQRRCEAVRVGRCLGCKLCCVSRKREFQPIFTFCTNYFVPPKIPIKLGSSTLYRFGPLASHRPHIYIRCDYSLRNNKQWPLLQLLLQLELEMLSLTLRAR